MLLQNEQSYAFFHGYIPIISLPAFFVFFMPVYAILAPLSRFPNMYVSSPARS
ncbi:hypothetical protein P691DRAFT_808746 [Macrolepiota fuliginosa MF-IS2]|uniref:Uncharacterized protein n=1 Tax=Macrolepiota fuliginosa MF-IS2 TaxID=1400762 RepID=A0A9P5X4N0_9AGAR|nr:hypothetical protein P691DRAFT_808746 [Macrolepiota fuliginosa MF-IS2]